LVVCAGQDYRCARATVAYYRATGDRALLGEAEASMRRLAGERDPSLPL
jgi:hypothetical protein